MKRVLYIDRVTDKSDMIHRGLQDAGYTVTFYNELDPGILDFARKAREAGEPFDFIISHLIPRNTEHLSYKQRLDAGAKLLSRLRANVGVPLIYYTGWGEVNKFVHTGYYQADSVVQKSTKPQNELAELITTLELLSSRPGNSGYSIIPKAYKYLLGMVEVPPGDNFPGFLISRFPVSIALYQQYYSSALEHIAPDMYRGYIGTAFTGASWYDAIAFCNWISPPESKVYDLGFYEKLIGTEEDIIPENANKQWDNISANLSASGYRLPKKDEFFHAWNSGLLSPHHPHSFPKDPRSLLINEWLQDLKPMDAAGIPSSNEPDDQIFNRVAAFSPCRKQISWENDPDNPEQLRPYIWHNTACYRDPRAGFRLVKAL